MRNFKETEIEAVCENMTAEYESVSIKSLYSSLFE